MNDHLENLLEKCGKDPKTLYHDMENDIWIAKMHGEQGKGKTPNEAVLDLYNNLN